MGIVAKGDQIASFAPSVGGPFNAASVNNTGINAPRVTFDRPVTVVSFDVTGGPTGVVTPSKPFPAFTSGIWLDTTGIVAGNYTATIRYFDNGGIQSFSWNFTVI